MDIFSKDELKTLVETQTVGCSCVSLYMPTNRSGRTDVQQNPVRLKKLLREAHKHLLATGLKKPEVESYLEPANRLLEDTFFWMNMSDGLAVYLSKDYFRYYRVPVPFPELSVVANRFHVKPMLPLLTVDGSFYVMALSQKAVRLLHCTRFSFDELDIKGKIPRSVAEALQYDHFDREQQFHAHMGVSNMDSGILLGHGQEVEETKDNLLRFFFLVDRALQREYLHIETVPLIIISVGYLFPIYKEANTYQNLLNTEVPANPDKMTAKELHEMSFKLAELYFKKSQEDAIKQYHKARPQLTTTNLEEIVSASYQGRVRLLFIADNQEWWGKYEPLEDKVAVHVKEEPCDVDLLDFIAGNTLAHRGGVFAVAPEKVPERPPVAAILRY